MGMGMIKFRFRLKDLRTRTKISLIILFLLVPIGSAVWTINADKQALIATSERELTGSAYIAALRPILFAMATSTRREDVNAAVETARATQKKLAESQALNSLAD